jgi:hypothetical protein
VKFALIPLVVAMAFLPVAALAFSDAEVVSKGARIELKKVLIEGGTTVVLFIQDSSAMEQQFLKDLESQYVTSTTLSLNVVKLKDTDAPAARQFEIKETPTAIVFDRFGRTLARTSLPDEIKAAVRKGSLMARIKWIDEDDPKAPETYGAPAAALKGGMPGIVKTMGLRREAFQMFNIMSQMHFSNGFLKRREHEMVGAYVSALNKCKF